MPCRGAPQTDVVNVELASWSLMGIQTTIVESSFVIKGTIVTVGGCGRVFIVTGIVVFTHNPVLSQTRTQILSVPA